MASKTKSAPAPKTTTEEPSMLSNALAKGRELSKDRDVRNMAKGAIAAGLAYCVWSTLTA